MTHVLAAEGGYQTFYLHGGEWAILLGSVATALLALARRLLPDARRARRRTRAPRR